MTHSSALPVARAALRTLILLNGLFGAAILALLIATVVAERWTFAALGLPPSPSVGPMMMGMRAIAMLGLVAIPLNHAVLRRLIAIVETVREGDPFVATNANRLNAIAWVLLALHPVGACQVGCRLGHAAKGWVSMLLRCAVPTESRSGLSVTTSM